MCGIRYGIPPPWYQTEIQPGSHCGATAQPAPQCAEGGRRVAVRMDVSHGRVETRHQ